MFQGTWGLCSTTSDSTMRTRSRSTGPRYCATNLGGNVETGKLGFFGGVGSVGGVGVGEMRRVEAGGLAEGRGGLHGGGFAGWRSDGEAVAALVDGETRMGRNRLRGFRSDAHSQLVLLVTRLLGGVWMVEEGSLEGLAVIPE